jgi:hypothetical protein|tara:strand:+ start:2883 stop:3350 length:468 start_codon:yes stop_codon:yes gene_type:complete
MKRLNPKTNKLFRCGVDVREDGYIFDGYISVRLKKDGYFKENWREPNSYKRNVEKKKIYKKNLYDKVSNYLNDYKLSKGCRECGYKKSPYALEFHHRDRRLKIKNVSNFRKSSWTQLENIVKEVQKCDILCSNCHKILTKKEINNASREKILERN